MKKINVDELEFEFDKDDPEGYRSGMKRFGKRLGAKAATKAPAKSVAKAAPTKPVAKTARSDPSNARRLSRLATLGETRPVSAASGYHRAPNGRFSKYRC